MSVLVVIHARHEDGPDTLHFDTTISLGSVIVAAGNCVRQSSWRSLAATGSIFGSCCDEASSMEVQTVQQTERVTSF